MSEPARVAGLLRPLDVYAARDASVGGRGLVSVVGLAAQGLIRFAVLFVIGRFAGPVALGVVATAMATAALAILLWPTTSGQAASRFVARARGRGDPTEVAAVLTHLNRRFVLATGALAAIVVPVWVLIESRADAAVGPGQAAVWAGGACVAAYLIGLAGQAYTRGVHYGCGAVTRVVARDVGTSLLGLAGVVALVAAGVRGLWLLTPVAGGLLVLSAGCWPWRIDPGAGPGAAPGAAPAPKPGLALRRELDRFVLYGSLGTLASAGLVQLSLLAARQAGDAAGAGQYAAATALANPLTLLSGAMSLVLYPTMAEAFGRGDRAAVGSQLDRGTRGLLVLVAPLVAVIAVLSPQLVALIWGSAYGETARLLPVILTAVLASMVAVPSVNALTSDDELPGIRTISLVSLIGLGVAVVGWLVLVPRLGVFGVSLGYAAGALTIAAYAVIRQWRAWRMPWSGPAVRVAGLGVGALAMVAWVPAGASTSRVIAAGVLVAAWLAVSRRDLSIWTALLSRR